jgi:hypothetical protein
MISALIESAFQTGYLSVESEGLIHQMLAARSYRPEDLKILVKLCDAVQAGHIKREASSNLLFELIAQYR